MILRHKFADYHIISYDGGIIDDPIERLIEFDCCIYCGLIVDDEIYSMFDDDNTDNPDYRFIYDKINNLYKCLTEDEYAIKKLLE